MLNRLLLGAEDADLILICLDDNCSEAELLNKFTQNSKSSTLILSDPKDSVEAQHVIRFEDKHTTASSSLKDLCDTTNIGTETVILKSLSSLLQFYSESSIACWLKALQTGCKALIAVVHLDCIDGQTLKQFQRLATTTLSIQRDPSGKKLCSTTHRKLGGKTVRSKELYWFQSGVLKVEPYVEKSETQSAEEITDKLTTFNLGTKKSEERAREELVLPFFTDQQKSSEGEVKISSAESNKIYYEPDSGDDWDDEDPDEDLDI